MEGDVQKSASVGVLGLLEISSYNHHDLDLFTQHLAPSVIFQFRYATTIPSWHLTKQFPVHDSIKCLITVLYNIATASHV